MTSHEPTDRVVPLLTPRRAARLLALRLATAPGLVRAGAARWDDGRTPIHPLSLENAYADPRLLQDLGARGARVAWARSPRVCGPPGGRGGGGDCGSPSSASRATAATRSTSRRSAAPT